MLTLAVVLTGGATRVAAWAGAGAAEAVLAELLGTAAELGTAMALGAAVWGNGIGNGIAGGVTGGSTTGAAEVGGFEGLGLGGGGTERGGVAGFRVGSDRGSSSNKACTTVGMFCKTVRSRPA